MGKNTDYNCSEILNKIRSLFEEGKASYKSALKDGQFWARIVGNKILNNVDRYLKEKDISPCRCKDYQKLNQISKLMEEYGIKK